MVDQTKKNKIQEIPGVGPASEHTWYVALADPTILLVALCAPLATGLATLLVPRRSLNVRLAIAAGGPICSGLLIALHLSRYGLVGNDRGTSVIDWMPTLHLNLSFLADGLAVFFAFLITGIGVIIVVYSRAYFGPDSSSLVRFFPLLGFFTSSMLGVVLADHLLLTVVFWEATSISSFLLIGWDRENELAVKRATQAFVTTGLGGLSIFGGVLLLGSFTDTWRWSELVASATTFGSSGTMIAAFVLIFLGAASKSAQWPFHYWLPGAMMAPTPVSAYLHSATMVKAGIFLLGRIIPIFGFLALWLPILVTFGSITMLLGAGLALRQQDLKRIFAYATVSQLGLFTCMYGLSGSHSNGEGVGLELTQIASHALYKAPLFLIAGGLTCRLGAKRLSELSGLWRRNVSGIRMMTLTLLAAVYALAGGPGTVNFVAKELFFESLNHATQGRPLLLVVVFMTLLTAICNVAIAVRFVVTVFSRRGTSGQTLTMSRPYNGLESWGMVLWLPAGLLVLVQYVGGLFPPVWNKLFWKFEAESDVAGVVDYLPWVWEPFTHPSMALVMSLVAIGAGIVLGKLGNWDKDILDPHDRVYPASYRMLLLFGHRVFHFLQTGHLRHYLVFVFVSIFCLFIWSALVDPRILEFPRGVSPFESISGLLLGMVVCLSAMSLPVVKERVVRVMVLGTSGFAVVGLYLVYQAPDLALTQLMFEIISVILFLVVLRLLPRLDRRPKIRSLPRLAVASLVGFTIGWMTLLVGQLADGRVNGVGEPAVTLGTFFEEHSHHGSVVTGGRGGDGQNIVNVILVDFRGFDTLGEITVLATAALGVWSMLPGRRRHIEDRSDRETESQGMESR